MNPRRPKARSLTVIYDTGAAAFRAGTKQAANPYRDTEIFGNVIRSGLWADGWLDEEANAMMELL